MYQQGGGRPKQNSRLRLAGFFQPKVLKSHVRLCLKATSPCAACLIVWKNTLRFWEYLLYLMRAQLYQFVCNRIWQAKHRREVASGGGAQEEGKLPIKHYPLEATCSHKLASTSLRNHCILKYFKQEQNKTWFLLMLAAWWVWAQTLCSWGARNGLSPQHEPCCSWTPATLCCQQSLLEGLCEVLLLCEKQTIRAGFFPTSAWFFQAARGVAAPSHRSGRDLTTADVL